MTIQEFTRHCKLASEKAEVAIEDKINEVLGKFSSETGLLVSALEIKLSDLAKNGFGNRTDPQYYRPQVKIRVEL